MTHRLEFARFVRDLGQRWALFVRRPFQAEKVEWAIAQFFRIWRELRLGGWRQPTIGALINNGFDMLTLYLLFVAAGHRVSIGALMVGYGLPRRWDIHFIRNFMFTFGFVSSFFDYLTFFLLLVILRSNINQFRTGWFLESVMTELLILLVVRTRKPFFQSRASNGLLISTLVVAILTLVLPYSPLNTLLGFAPLSVGVLFALAGITLLYVAASEIAKHYFYRYVRA
ncbi:MAG: cation transporting ATPase C-terminal domain-containing protein [Caldilineaceae bacterium]